MEAKSGIRILFIDLLTIGWCDGIGADVVSTRPLIDIYTDETAPSRGLSAICDDQVGYAKGSIEPDLLLVRVLRY
jgi:hypothetical protein